MHFGTFQQTVWNFYAAHRRDLPWRMPALQPDKQGYLDTYTITVSEIMLQQTQASRVIPKFEVFLDLFPTVYDLAQASLADVLAAWSGLGYNRRAKYLHELAQRVAHQHSGRVPLQVSELVALPGIGINTAGAIVAYAYSQPVLFIETNIRSVYIHEFFPDTEQVDDRQIIPLLEQTIDQHNPREWYWALMDYGSHIKVTHGNPNRRSSGYSRQSPFAGSLRQVRGAVIRQLAGQRATSQELASEIADDRLPRVLADLVREKLVQSDGHHYFLPQ